MSPEEYQRAGCKLVRYGEHFDMSLDSKLPQPLKKTKAGKVAKRQPAYDERTKSYYQAQCSFRGLKTSGGKDELQQLLQHRDVRNDLEIRRELDQLENERRDYEKELERFRFERWWNDPASTFEAKLRRQPQRALEEEMQKPNSFLLKDCRVYRGHRYDLSRAAANLSLGYEAVSGPIDLPPGEEIQQCQIIGEATAVATNVIAFKQDAEKKVREQWASYNARFEAAKAQIRAERQAFRDQASSNDDWDLTGKWIICCDQLSQYRTGPDHPEKLHMEIFKDDYKLNAVRVDEAESDSEDGEDYGRVLGCPGYYGNPERRMRTAPVPESVADSRRPRYCARFHFGVVEGVMRIYPRSSSREWTAVKDNPTFELRWRGRETGEGEIQTEALEYPARTITFSNVGIKFEGLFDCPYISGVLRFTGTKTTHGRGQTLSSANEWREMNEKAWSKESRSRWH
jgi:hypothetical protein